MSARCGKIILAIDWSQIVGEHGQMVFRTAFRVLGNAADAEDVAQEVFIQVYRSIDQFKGDARLSTWIYRITTTKALDHIRSRKRKKRFAFITSLFGPNDELVHEPVDFQHPGVALAVSYTHLTLPTILRV